MQSPKNVGHGAVFSLIRGLVRSGIQERGWVENRVVSLDVGIFFTVRGKILKVMK